MFPPMHGGYIYHAAARRKQRVFADPRALMQVIYRAGNILHFLANPPDRGIGIERSTDSARKGSDPRTLGTGRQRLAPRALPDKRSDPGRGAAGLNSAGQVDGQSGAVQAAVIWRACSAHAKLAHSNAPKASTAQTCWLRSAISLPFENNRNAATRSHVNGQSHKLARLIQFNPERTDTAQSVGRTGAVWCLHPRAARLFAANSDLVYGLPPANLPRRGLAARGRTRSRRNWKTAVPTRNGASPCPRGPFPAWR
jgi:hypothetical protein